MKRDVERGAEPGCAAGKADTPFTCRGWWSSRNRACSAGAVALFVLVTAVALSADAEATPEKEKLATVSAEGGSIVFVPSSNRAMTLKVGGAGLRSMWRIPAGQALVLAPIDEQGQPLPDGIYKWELVEELDRSEGTSAMRERSAGGGEGRREPSIRRRLQGGSFSVLNGSLVDPTRLEESSDSAPESQGEGR